jgi:ArsR family transcriptional regulator, arsenate/arsenite/antimonite-responsive transcriptional repressor
VAGKKLAKCAVSEDVLTLADRLKVLSDVNRLRIICLLFSGEKCVCEIEEGIDISQPLASHHLKVLLEAGLVHVRREGTWSYYALDRAAVEGLNASFREFLGAERMQEVYTAGTACCKPGSLST